ncbi:hypothetical protein [Streptomyces sp. NPDC052225]|uniref:hypothetical protein n=1 Tax=Streptomyces sp. NPDC052225 TaxID=3154949 RepID=UPI003420FCBA
MRTTKAMRAMRPMKAILWAAALVPLAAACSAEPALTRAAPERPAAAAPARETAPAPTREAAPVDPVLPLDPSETLAGRQRETSGERVVPFRAGAEGQDLIVAVRCRGTGEITVSLRPLHARLKQKCGAGDDATTYNRLGVTGAEKAGNAVVRAPSGARWSLTLGRGESPAEDRL